MSPVEERLDGLEQRLERIESLLKEVKESVEEAAAERARHHRHFAPPDPYRAIARAREEEFRTFAWGMKLAGGLLVSALVCWLGFRIYQDVQDGQWNRVPVRLGPP